MCQIEIYNFLRDLRATGDENYYIATEIYDKMKKNNIDISYKRFSEKLTRLWWFGFIEKAPELRRNKMKMYNRVQYRAKHK